MLCILCKFSINSAILPITIHSDLQLNRVSLQEMGCRPSSTVTEDPAVPLYTVVRNLVITVAKKNDSKVEVENHIRHGLLYVKDGELHYDAAFGTRLMPKNKTKSWKLQNIQQISVTNKKLLVRRPGVNGPPRAISAIALDIHVEDVTTDTQLQMVMPYVEMSSAEVFKSRLEQLTKPF